MQTLEGFFFGTALDTFHARDPTLTYFNFPEEKEIL